MVCTFSNDSNVAAMTYIHVHVYDFPVALRFILDCY